MNFTAPLGTDHRQLLHQRDASASDATRYLLCLRGGLATGGPQQHSILGSFTVAVGSLP